MIIGINTLFLLPGKVGGTETYVRFRMKSKTVRGMEHVTNILQGE